MLENRIKELYRIINELEKQYPGRHFTPDGHLIGSIGEVYASEKYGLKLLTASAEKHDAETADGRMVQIKITQTDRASIYSEPDYLIVLKMNPDGQIEEIYNGKGAEPWMACGKLQKNGHRTISIRKLKEINAKVPVEDRIRNSLQE